VLGLDYICQFEFYLIQLIYVFFSKKYQLSMETLLRKLT